MKRITLITGYAVALLTSIALVFKLAHLPGTGEILRITGILLSPFFALFVLDKLRENDGRSMPSHFVAAASALLINLGVTSRIWYMPADDIILISGLLLFSLVYIPMRVLQNTQKEGADNIRNVAGALGFICLSVGLLFKLQYLPGSWILLLLSPVFFFLVYFPRLMADKSMEAESKRRLLRNSFFTIIIGSLVTLYLAQSIEIHDRTNVAENEWYEEAIAQQ